MIPPYYLNRRNEVTITRCRIGHSFQNYSFLISENFPPTCDECHAGLSVQHIIQNCTKYRDIRNNLAIPPNMEVALNENNITKIITFLTKIHLISKSNQSKQNDLLKKKTIIRVKFLNNWISYVYLLFDFNFIKFMNFYSNKKCFTILK